MGYRENPVANRATFPDSSPSSWKTYTHCVLRSELRANRDFSACVYPSASLSLPFPSLKKQESEGERRPHGRQTERKRQHAYVPALHKGPGVTPMHCATVPQSIARHGTVKRAVPGPLDSKKARVEGGG